MPVVLSMSLTRTDNPCVGLQLAYPEPDGEHPFRRPWCCCLPCQLAAPELCLQHGDPASAAKTVQLSLHSHAVAAILAGLSHAADRGGLEEVADHLAATQTFYGIFGVFMTPDLPAASVLSAMSYGMPLSGPAED